MINTHLKKTFHYEIFFFNNFKIFLRYQGCKGYENLKSQEKLAEHYKLFITFLNLVQSEAETCYFTTVNECDCGRNNMTIFTDEALKDVMSAMR